jgi:hypothetical protein
MGFSWKSSSAGLLPFVREENFLAQWCDVAHLVYTYIVDLAAHFSTANHKGRGRAESKPVPPSIHPIPRAILAESRIFCPATWYLKLNALSSRATNGLSIMNNPADSFLSPPGAP